MLQLQLMLFVDFTITNIQIIRPTKIMSSCLNLKFGGSGNLLDVLMKSTNYCDDGFIAKIHNSAKVWVAYSKYAIADKSLKKGLYTKYWVSDSAGFSAGSIQSEFSTFDI